LCVGALVVSWCVGGALVVLWCAGKGINK